MARRVYSFENPDRFVAGTVGQPGNRTFYLQARDGSRISTVLLEKIQVSLLAERLTELLVQVKERGATIPDAPNPSDIDNKPLDEPIEELFRVGTLAIVWDGDDESILVEARAMGEEDEEAEATEEDEDDEENDVLRVRLQPAGALAFAQRALEVVASGRPPCPFCGQPLNPEGHICARRNGFMH